MSKKPELHYTTVDAGSAVAQLGTAMYSEIRSMPGNVAGQVLTHLVCMIFINTQFKDSTPAQTFEVFAEGVRKTLDAWEKDQ